MTVYLGGEVGTWQLHLLVSCVFFYRSVFRFKADNEFYVGQGFEVPVELPSGDGWQAGDLGLKKAICLEIRFKGPGYPKEKQSHR